MLWCLGDDLVDVVEVIVICDQCVFWFEVYVVFVQVWIVGRDIWWIVDDYLEVLVIESGELVVVVYFDVFQEQLLVIVFGQCYGFFYVVYCSYCLQWLFVGQGQGDGVGVGVQVEYGSGVCCEGCQCGFYQQFGVWVWDQGVWCDFQVQVLEVLVVKYVGYWFVVVLMGDLVVELFVGFVWYDVFWLGMQEVVWFVYCCCQQ